MLSPQFCCCAIPLVNAGIYSLLSEQFALAMLAGVLAISTPTIVGTAVPTYTPYILAALSFIIAALQVIGFYGVFKEQRRTYKFYAIANTCAFAAVFILAAALIAVSGARHSEAVSKCLSAYYSGDGISTTSEGKQVCEAFAWVDVGVMAGLWLLLFVVQSYLCFITRVYARNQKDEHQRYKSIYDANAEEFAMVEQMQRYGVPGDAWDHRPSLDSLDGRERPYSYAPATGSNLKYSDSAVLDTGATYADPTAEQMQRGEFASEAEEREYYQSREFAEQQGYEHGQGYEQQHGDEQQHGYEHQQGYPQEYSDAQYPAHAAQGSAPPDYPAPAPHAMDGGMVASGPAARGDGKYGYVPR